jgi:hypothetical protein
MKFKLGLAIGFAAGYWVGTQADEERRRQVQETVDKVRGNPRVQRVTDTVSRSAVRITDAVEERLVDTAGGAADKVASTVEPDGGHNAAAGTGATGTTGTTGTTGSVE